jgi:hypothetical protein
MNKHLIRYLAPGTGVLIAALANPLVDHLNAFTMDDLFDAPRNAINSLATGSSQAQTPLEVPRMEAPIGNAGNSASIQPCAAPPPVQVAAVPTPEAVPSSIGRPIQPAAGNGGQQFNDRKAKVLMNLAPGNQIASVYRRLHSPDSTNMQPPEGGIIDYYSTTDGLIEVKHSSGVITSIKFVQTQQ